MDKRTISKIISIIIVMALCAVFAIFTQGGDNSGSFESVENARAQQLMDSLQQDLIIIDVRTAGEFAGGHLPKAVNIDVKSDSFETAIKSFDDWQNVLIYCRSGRRSKTAATIAADLLPDTKIYELDHGILGWDGNVE